MGEQSFIAGGHRHRGNFLDRLGDGLTHALNHALDAGDVSQRDGLLQSLDPRIKLAGLFGLIIVAVCVKSLGVLAGLFLLAVGLALASHVPLSRLFRQVWLSVLAFTGVIAAPAIFLVPGEPAFQIPLLHWTATAPGLRSAAFLLGRAETAATFALLLILCTPWPHVLKALRLFRAPVVLVVILGMTHRYIFILLRTASQMIEARRSRTLGRLPPRERRRMTAAIAGELFGKALDLATEVHLAMISRGYRGEVHLMNDFQTRPRDWAALGGFAAVAITALWLQA
jgi:cobalt/nickel transport system permease protein